MPEKTSRFAAWKNRVANRLARSSRVFLFGLIVACGIEVMVDWNQTFFEITVLRDQIRQKGVNYASLLTRVISEPLLKRQLGTVDRLASAILDDPDAVYVRIVSPEGKVLYDRMDRNYEKVYLKRGKGPFRHHYEHWLERDMNGVLNDLAGFKLRLANSRYRDLPQIWADTTARATAALFPPEPAKEGNSEVIYQDRLRDEHHRRDDTITWAVGVLEYDGRKVGAVLIAFDMTHVNQELRNKYLKGLGMVVFFIALILMQNISGRRDKLRLLELEERYATRSKDSVESMPPTAKA